MAGQKSTNHSALDERTSCSESMDASREYFDEEFILSMSSTVVGLALNVWPVVGMLAELDLDRGIQETQQVAIPSGGEGKEEALI